MQMSDVLGTKLVDGDGVVVGIVSDVRLVQDGPFIEGFGSALRVDALVIGRGGVGARLGYVRGGVRGPWALRVLASRLEGRARLVRWTDVERVDDLYRTRLRRAELPRLGAVYREHGR
jgi:hypothetical protein